jgi:glycine cleavage system aminomethyltransferase T
MTLEGLNEDFRDALVLLADGGVEFVIVGAYALAFHGAPRASGDIDVFVRPSPANAQRVFDALTRFGAPLQAAGVTAADFARPGAVYQIGLPPRRIDLLTEVSGLSFDDAWASRITAEVEGRTVSFIGREALLRNKEASGRPKDLADLARLRRPARPPDGR